MSVTPTTSRSTGYKHDVLIIGSGAAGLSLALHLPRHYRIALISKADLKQGSTYWAQGGMAAVLHTRDTVDSHVEDTLNAGGGLCTGMLLSSPFVTAEDAWTGW